ncbi:hypothetical protein [Nioella aestuarii]|uniref:hypothetical protein n=1 Tax=Nioella aestuarii TaxID=1662864 RepID=UPI003D7FB160
MTYYSENSVPSAFIAGREWQNMAAMLTIICIYCFYSKSYTEYYDDTHRQQL